MSRDDEQVWAISQRHDRRRHYLVAVIDDTLMWEPSQSRALRFTRAEAERRFKALVAFGAPMLKGLVSDVGEAPATRRFRVCFYADVTAASEVDAAYAGFASMRRATAHAIPLNEAGEPTDPNFDVEISAWLRGPDVSAEVDDL